MWAKTVALHFFCQFNVKKVAAGRHVASLLQYGKEKPSLLRYWEGKGFVD